MLLVHEQRHVAGLLGGFGGVAASGLFSLDCQLPLVAGEVGGGGHHCICRPHCTGYKLGVPAWPLYYQHLPSSAVDEAEPLHM